MRMPRTTFHLVVLRLISTTHAHCLPQLVKEAFHLLLLFLLFTLDLLLFFPFLQELHLCDNASDDSFLDDVYLRHVEHDEEEVKL